MKYFDGKTGKVYNKKTIMKIKISIVLLMVLSLLVSPRDSISQDGYTDSNKKGHSPEENKLQTEFKAARISGDKNKMAEIQNQLDAITGSVTKQANNDLGSYIEINRKPPQITFDNINIVELSQLKGIQALVTSTEQRGSNTGRIWIAAAVSNTPASDSIYYFYSDDGGTSWVLYTIFFLANSSQINYDQMDMEIIEDNTGNKYIWAVYGITASNGKQFSGANVIKTPVFQATAFALTWAGENFSNTNFRRIRPRITSDNAMYSNTAAVYILVSTDTLSGGVHWGWYNYAKCINPYTASPSVTYIPEPHILILGSNSLTDLQGDIAYMYKNGDSLLIVGSNTYSNPADVFVRSAGTNFNMNQNAVTIFQGNNNRKEFARIATSGGDNQLLAMIVYRENYQNSGDWDLKAQLTGNGGQIWASINIDIRRDLVFVPQPPDICGVRNMNGRFNIAYTISGNQFDTLKYVTTGPQQQSLLYFSTQNHISSAYRPKAGVRLVNNDSCFAVWSEQGTNSGNNIWASGGCNGPFTIGIENLGNEMPSSYKLEQNYPNPFNPVTNIKFSIPKTGLVKLVVYDMLGKEVETLVNENLQAGTYKSDFDASGLSSGVYLYKLITDGYSQTRKMLLVK